MDISPVSQQVREVFHLTKEEFYKIPIYQRNYSWGYDNIEIFFNDINIENDGYYIGNLLVTPTYDVEKTYDVVDGQQRLTTIALMLLATYHVLFEKIEKDKVLDLNKEKNMRLYEKINNIKYDIKRQLLYTDSSYKSHSRLILLDDDMKMYEEFLTILEGNIDYKPYKNRKFGKRYHFIKDLLEDSFFTKDSKGKYEDLEQSFDKLFKFYEKLNGLEILKIKVDNLTDAFSIFTSFNSKGLPLTLIDLLKSYYLKNAVTYLDEEDALENWHNLISYFYDENNEPISSLVTQFLQNYYDTFESDSTSSITKSQSLREYERLFAKKGGDYINSLISGAKIFSSFTNNIGKFSKELGYKEENSNSKDKLANIEYYIRKLSILDTTAIYPIMIYLLIHYSRNNISAKNLINNLNYLTNYYIRRNIVLKPKSSNLRAKSLLAIRRLENEEDINEKSLEIIKSSLNSIASSDREFYSSLLDSNVYEINKQTTRVMLIDLEQKYGEFFDKQTRDTLNDKDGKNNYIWTIEHIMPQSANLSDSWKKSISKDLNLTEEEILQEHSNSVHKLGNLTLTGYNSEMSNRDFLDKRDYKGPYSSRYSGLKTDLFLNKSIFDGDLEKDFWNQDDIERRTKYLADLIVSLYKLKK